MNPGGPTRGVRGAFLSCTPLLLNGILFGGCGSVPVKKVTVVRKKGATTMTLLALSKYLPKYADTVTGPVSRQAFTGIFRKDPATLTVGDCREVWHVRFETVDSSLSCMNVTLGDGSEKQVSIVSGGERIALDRNLSQALPNLEALDMSGQRSLLQVTFSSQEYTNALANLKQPRRPHLPDRGEYPGSPAGLAYSVVNPGAIEELDGVTLYATADVEELVQKFLNLKRLRIVKREPGVTPSGLQRLKELGALYMSLRCVGNEDLLSPTGVREMELIVSGGNEDIKEFRFLSGLTELESLAIRDAVLLLNLNDIKPLAKLRELRLSGATQLTNLEPLREFTALGTLDLGDNFSLSDYATLYELPQFKRLRISNGWQVGCFIPDVILLPTPEELECGAETLPQLARYRKLRKSTLFPGHIGSGTDFSGPSRPSEFEELTLNVESATQNTKKLDAFREPLKSRKVIFSCGQGALLLHAFPAVTKLIVPGETAEADGGSSELHILAATGEDAPALEKLFVFAFGVVYLEGYHSTTLRELCLGSCGIDSFAFTETFPSLELLNISDNRAEDIASLMAPPKFRYLCYTDNAVRNTGLLEDRGIALVE